MKDTIRVKISHQNTTVEVEVPGMSSKYESDMAKQMKNVLDLIKGTTESVLNLVSDGQ